MNQMKIPFVLLLALFVCSLAWASGRGGPEQGFGGRGVGNGRGQGGPGGRGGRGRQGGFDEGFDGSQGPGGREKPPCGSRGHILTPRAGFDNNRDCCDAPDCPSYYRQSNGYDSKRYRSNLYSDDDVYGYDATYPNGEAAYINYKSKDARARRGPEFARTSRAYSRQGGGGERGFGQGNEFRGRGAGMW